VNGTPFVERRKKTSRTPLDVFIIILCLSGAAVSIYLFYQDLYSTFRFSTVLPAGTVTVKFNTVQRRFSDRLVWDRLTGNSPVYEGDIIRVAKQSGATLDIDDNEIELGENTLIRIQRDAGRLKIEFFSGEINVTSGADSELILISIGDRIIEAAPGTILNAAAEGEGFILHVTEGSAQIIQAGQVTHAPAGTVLAEDEHGNIVFQPMAAVTYPRPNAQLLKTEHNELVVDFEWSRLNMQSSDLLRLEIAEDRNFNRIVHRADNLHSGAIAPMEPGTWYWRLSLDDNNLTSGRFSVTEAAPPVLFSPAEGQLYYLDSERQEVMFRWSEVEDAMFYIFELSDTPDFSAVNFTTQVQTTTFVKPYPESGHWYWRVQPVFSSAFVGTAQFTHRASFSIEQKPEVVPLIEEPEVIDIAEIAEPAAEEPALPVNVSLVTPHGAIALNAPLNEQFSTQQTVPPVVPQSLPLQTLPAPVPLAAPPVQTAQAVTPPEPTPPPPATAPPVPLLPAPENMLPVTGFRLDAENLRHQRNIVFSWSAVQGANSYIVTIYREAFPRRVQIFQAETKSELSLTFDDFRLLDNGTFIWQVEAVTYDNADRIIRRGRQGESSFLIDVPRPGRVQTRDMGRLYGME